MTEAFKAEAVGLGHQSGLTVEQVGSDLGIGKSTLIAWRRELKIVRQERDLLKETQLSSPKKQSDDVQMHRCGEGGCLVSRRAAIMPG
ncbi:MAG: transposase, partial [Pseudomonadota bacterium]